MNKKLAELTVNKLAYYQDKIIKALEEAGYQHIFVLVLEGEGITEKHYIIAKSEKV